MATPFSWLILSIHCLHTAQSLAATPTGKDTTLTMVMLMKKTSFHRRRFNTALNTAIVKMNRNSTMTWHRRGYRLDYRLIALDNMSPPELLDKLCNETLSRRANLIFYIDFDSEKLSSFESSVDYLLKVINFLELPVMVWMGENSGNIQPSPDSTILQLAPSISHQCQAMLSLLRWYNWKAFAVVTGSMAGQEYFVNVLRNLAEQWRLEILAVVNIPSSVTDSQLNQRLNRLHKNEARIILLYATHKESERILSQAESMLLTGKEFVWIVCKTVLGQNSVNIPPSFHSGMIGINFQNDPEGNVLTAIRAVVSMWAHAMDSLLQDSDKMADRENISLVPRNSECSAITQEKWKDGRHLFRYIRDTSIKVDETMFGFNEEDGTARDTEVEIVNLYRDGWKRIGKWSSTKHLHMDDITWPFGETSPPKGRPEKYRVRVVTLQEKPYVVYSDPDQAGSCPPQSVPCQVGNPARSLTAFNVTANGSIAQCCSGLCIDLLKMLSEKIGLEFELFEASDRKWGAKVKGEWNGLIKTILDGEADMVVTSLKITPERSEAVDFSVPFLETGIAILVAVRDGVISPTAFLEPYDYPSWCLILVFSVHACGSSLFLFEWLSPNGLDRGLKPICEHKFSLFRAFWLIWTMLFGAAVNVDNPRGVAGRFLANIWALFAVVFTASYTANLAAFMITKVDYDDLAGIHDTRLLNPYSNKPPFKYATVSHGSTDTTLQNKYPSMYQYMRPYNKTDAPEGVRAVKDGDLNAFIYDATVLEYLASHDDGCKLRTVGNWYAMTGYGIGFPKGSKWISIINKFMVQFQHDGEMERLQKFWLAGVCKKNDAKGESSMPLGILNFTSAFLLLAAGMVIVGLLLLLEHVYFKFLRTRLRKWDHNGCCSLVSLSVGKSLTFEQSVREAIELQRNFRCRHPICETQVWKLKHELDMARLNIDRLQRLIRLQHSKSENSMLLKNNPEHLLDGKEGLEECHSYCPKAEDEEDKMAIKQSLKHSPQNLQNLSTLTRQKSILETPNRSNLPRYSEVASVEETAAVSGKRLNLGGTSSNAQSVTSAGVNAGLRRARWQRSWSLPSATTKVTNRWKTVETRQPESPVTQNNRSLSPSTSTNSGKPMQTKREAKSQMEETTVQIETTL